MLAVSVMALEHSVLTFTRAQHAIKQVLTAFQCTPSAQPDTRHATALYVAFGNK